LFPSLLVLGLTPRTSTADLAAPATADAMDVDLPAAAAAAVLEAEYEEPDEGASDSSASDAEGSLAALVAGGTDEDSEERRARIDRVAAAASEAQPTGTTLETTTVTSQVPFLFRGQLREYQLIGMDWLRHMYEKGLNVVLADEMGLGKTIQTIAVLAWLASERNNWGPHLIVVPSSVVLNWEIEFKRFCPAFKILTYYGNQRERRALRVGWTKPNAFHVCITSYALAVSDHQVFRRKRWQYLILDEAHNIKNFKSRRWQRLLTFPSRHRLLLTGTPLQNNLMELWSLMHFLMPHRASPWWPSPSALV
jgi:SNF2 family DNA or RNA helicase